MRRDDGAVGVPVSVALNRLAAGIAGMALVFMGAPVPRSLAGQSPQPNILIVMTDDQRRQGTMSVMDAVKTRFRESGMRFPRAVATTPVCCPSRASIFTGRYAHNHGVLNNRSGPELQQNTTLQRYLHDAGYLTGYAGKFLNGWPIDTDPAHFDHWALMRPAYENPEANVDGELEQGNGYTTDVLGGYAMEFLADFEQTDDKPWFLMVAPVAPHNPATPEAKYAQAHVPPWERNPAVGERNLSDKPRHLRSADYSAIEAEELRARQLRTLMSVDDLVDDLFTELEAADELSETFAIYTSDNGYLWAEHRLEGKGQPYRPSVGVPMFLRWPGMVPEGTSDRRLAANIDIAPTVLQAADVSGLAVPLDGRSLLGKSRSEILTEKQAGKYRWAALSTRRYQYVEWYKRGRRSVYFREYYDWRRDPWELRNLLGDDRPKNDPSRALLHRRLARLRERRGTSGTRSCP
jgi:arylsulfatase A-like enzyme